jgi:hypothetical protein
MGRFFVPVTMCLSGRRVADEKKANLRRYGDSQRAAEVGVGQLTFRIGFDLDSSLTPRCRRLRLLRTVTGRGLSRLADLERVVEW